MCCVDTQCIAQYWLSLLIVFTAAGRETVCAQNTVCVQKCTTTDLFTEEEDGRVSGWSQELTSFVPPCSWDYRGDSEVQSDAPKMSAKWTEFRQEAGSYLWQLPTPHPYI